MSGLLSRCKVAQRLSVFLFRISVSICRIDKNNEMFQLQRSRFRRAWHFHYFQEEDENGKESFGLDSFCALAHHNGVHCI